MTTTPAPATLADLTEQRQRLEQRRATLTAQRPTVALAAAGGTPDAITDARHLTEELADLAVQLDGLDVAEQELRRLETVRKREQAAAAEQDRVATVAEVRGHLGQALTELEAVLLDLEHRVARVDTLAIRLDQLEVRPAQAPPFRQRFLAARVVGRARAALALWRGLLGPGGWDTKALGPGDVT